MEPSMIELCDMVSFSDAHEEKEIPVIAANVHRMIPPGQSEIWAVLRAEDTGKRIVYSMANTFLGVMCLSGDVHIFPRDSGNWWIGELNFIRRSAISYEMGIPAFMAQNRTAGDVLKDGKGSFDIHMTIRKPYV